MNEAILHIDSISKSYLRKVVAFGGKAAAAKTLIIDDLDLLTIEADQPIIAMPFIDPIGGDLQRHGS